jgi:hypothetical protein
MHPDAIAPATRGFIFMQLEEYPAAIATLAHKVNELTHELYEAEMARTEIETRIDFEAAFNPHLKNDQQRRADRAFKLLQNEEHRAINVRCVSLGQKRASAIVERETAQDKFRVAKLLMEREIAQMPNFEPIFIRTNDAADLELAVDAWKKAMGKENGPN